MMLGLPVREGTVEEDEGKVCQDSAETDRLEEQNLTDHNNLACYLVVVSLT